MKPFYFMDFIKDNFKDLEALEKVFIKSRCRKRKKYDLENYRNIFEMLYLENNKDLKNIFDSYIFWSSSCRELGFSCSGDLKEIHQKWYNIVRKFQNSDKKILFEKIEYLPLQINFEGEQNGF